MSSRQATATLSANWPPTAKLSRPLGLWGRRWAATIHIHHPHLLLLLTPKTDTRFMSHGGGRLSQPECGVWDPRIRSHLVHIGLYFITTATAVFSLAVAAVPTSVEPSTLRWTIKWAWPIVVSFQTISDLLLVSKMWIIVRLSDTEGWKYRDDFSD